MTNEVTTAKQTGLGALSALKTGLTQVRTKLPEVASSPYLRLLKDGNWVFGQDDTVIAAGTEAAVNPLSIKHGYTCWTNRQPGEGKNELLGEILVGLNATLPAVHELEQKIDPQTGRPAPWKDQMSVDIKLMDGKHKGTQVLWKVSSVGGLNAAKGILDAILGKLDEGTSFVCPIITFDSDSYKHPTYGKTYIPKLDVVGWMDLEGNEEDGDEAAAKLEAPKAVDEKIAEAEPEPEQEEAPARRRRRV